MNGRRERRSRWDKAKARARRIMRLWGIADPDPRDVAHCAETHCRPCSCWMCRHKPEIPIKGRKA